MAIAFTSVASNGAVLSGVPGSFGVALGVPSAQQMPWKYEAGRSPKCEGVCLLVVAAVTCTSVACTSGRTPEAGAAAPALHSMPWKYEAG